MNTSIKIKITSCIKIFTYFGCFLILRYLFVIPTERIRDSANVQNVIVVMLGGIALFLTIYYRRVQWLNGKLFKNYFIGYMICITAVEVYSIVRYGYSLKTIVLSLIPFLFMVYLFPVIAIFCRDNSVEPFLSKVTDLEMLILIIKTVSWVSYNFWQTGLLNNYIYEFAENWTRNGIHRLEAGQLFGVAFVYSLYSFLRGKKRIKYFSYLLFEGFFIIAIEQSRYRTIVLAVTLAVMCYFAYQGNKKILIRTLLIIVITALIVSGVISEITYSFGAFGKNASSFLLRQEGLFHYFKLMKRQKSFFGGLGLLDLSNINAHFMMQRTSFSSYKVFYLDDVGIFGGIIRFGYLAIIIYLWPMVLQIKTFLRALHIRKREYVLLLSGMGTYLWVYCIVSNCFDLQRAFAMPFYLAVFSYISGEMTQMERKG